jgi:hypothetical protein
MAMERANLGWAKGRAINMADLPTPENVKSYITNCLERYQKAHNLPEDSVKVSDTHSTPLAGGPRVNGDAYHYHSCGLSNDGCKKVQEYQLQIQLLEHHNKRRLMMARAETNASSVTPKQPIETPTMQELKFRTYTVQDYQRQLMRGEMQAKKEHLTFSAPGQGDTVAPTKSEPLDPLNEQAMKNLSLEEYQKQLMVLRCGHQRKDKLKCQAAMTQCPSGVTDTSRSAKQEAPPAEMQVMWSCGQPKAAPMPAGAPPLLAGASMDFLPTFANANHPKTPTTAHQYRSPIQDYNMQLLLLEQQNKKRLMMARQEQDKITLAVPPNTQDGGKPKQHTEESLALARREREKLAANGGSNAQESEQIMEMGSALRAQNVHDKRDVSEFVQTEPEDESDTAMWSTDEFDEWSNCEDDMETAKKLEV